MAEPVTWHPPRAVLEIAELVLTGALPALPVALDLRVNAGEPTGEPTDPPAAVVLEDAEGTPVARVVGRQVEALKPFAHGPVRAARLAPEVVRAQAEGAVAVPVAGSLSAAAVAAAVEYAGDRLVWLVLVGDRRRVDLPPAPLVRAVRALAAEVGGLVVPVAVPLLPGTDDAALLEQVARGHGAADVFAPSAAGASALHPAFEHERRRVVRPPHRRGLTVFFTGLSGSGKSTVAKALAEQLEDVRTVSLLDGDEVRRLLSAGLGFGRADRDLNIRRIGFVAAEVTRHGGLAICAPIAPFEQARAEVRAAVEEHGDFVLVHVNTPLAECERRDRKGLYAKARAGEIPLFTGISSPYEEPADADLRLDTSQLSIDRAVDAVRALLSERGYLGDDRATGA